MNTATTEIYTLSLHDALPICPARLTRPPRFTASPHRSRKEVTHGPPRVPSEHCADNRRGAGVARRGSRSTGTIHAPRYRGPHAAMRIPVQQHRLEGL